MAIDFSKVKKITIPEGSVKKITDSTGAVLWKEKSAEWHTVWEGNKKIGYGGYTGSEFLFATEPYSDTLKIRVSFFGLNAYNSSSGDEGYSNYTPSNQISPVTYNSISSNLTTLVEAYRRNTTRNAYYDASLYYNKNNGKIYGSTNYYNEAEARAYFYVTKIEVYS